MKKAIVVGLLAIVGIAVGLTMQSGALAVGTGLSAKLACSGFHLSGLDEQNLYSDIDSYAPLSGVLRLAFADGQREITANLLGLSETSATFRPGLGCALDIGDTSTLDQLVMPAIEPIDAPWPMGAGGGTPTPRIQSLAEDILAQDNAAGLQTRALLVAVDGELVAEAYAPGFDDRSQLMGWSMGKSVTAMMLGRLEQLGKVDVSTTPGFAEWRADERSAITLEQMLQMSTGLGFSEVYGPGSDATLMLFNSHRASDVAMASPLEHSPSTHFYYSSGTTNLLNRYVEGLLGGPQAVLDFLRTEFYQTLNLTKTTFETDPSGTLVGSSYIYASARDWAKLGQLMLNDGRWGDQQLLSADWVARAATPNKSTNDPRYGYQFWLNRGGDQLRWPSLPEDTYAMLGNRAQRVFVIPSANAVVVRLGWSNTRYPGDSNVAQLLAARSET